MLLDLIIKKTIKNYEKTNDVNVRTSYGVLGAIIGIITNFILIIIKLTIGIIINSVSVIANAIDSLSDFGSNIITLLGFKMSKKPADKEHPFGHQRIEYVSGLIVSLLICFIGGSVMVTSIEKMVTYTEFVISDKMFIVTISILAVTILIKIYQHFAYNKLAKIIDSSNLHDNAVDALMDIISAVIIISGLVINFILLKNNIKPPFSIDGLLGILEAILIVISGIKLVKSEVDSIIGKSTNSEFIDKINKFIKSYDKVLGTHDIICHMYGPNKCYMTIHVEVDENSIFKEIDEYTEKIEDDVLKKFGVNLTIHMDPTNPNDLEKKDLEVDLDNILYEISNKLSFHDLRIIRKLNCKILVFDLIVPYKFELDNSEIYEIIDKKINNQKNDKYILKINFDHPYSE